MKDCTRRSFSFKIGTDAIGLQIENSEVYLEGAGLLTADDSDLFPHDEVVIAVRTKL